MKKKKVKKVPCTWEKVTIINGFCAKRQRRQLEISGQERLRVGSEKKQHGKHSQNSEALAYASNLHAYVCELKGAGDNSSFFSPNICNCKSGFYEKRAGAVAALKSAGLQPSGERKNPFTFCLFIGRTYQRNNKGKWSSSWCLNIFVCRIKNTTKSQLNDLLIPC